MTTIQTQRPTLVYVAHFYPDLTGSTGLLLGSSAIPVKASHRPQQVERPRVPLAQGVVVHRGVFTKSPGEPLLSRHSQLPRSVEPHKLTMKLCFVLTSHGRQTRRRSSRRAGLARRQCGHGQGDPGRLSGHSRRRLRLLPDGPPPRLRHHGGWSTAQRKAWNLALRMRNGTDDRRRRRLSRRPRYECCARPVAWGSRYPRARQHSSLCRISSGHWNVSWPEPSLRRASHKRKGCRRAPVGRPLVAVWEHGF